MDPYQQRKRKQYRFGIQLLKDGAVLALVRTLCSPLERVKIILQVQPAVTTVAVLVWILLK